MPRDFHLSTFLPYRLAVLSERVSRRLAVEYGRSHGISIPEWRVLVHLGRSGAASVRDITAWVNLEKPRVSRAVARLEGRGLVAKLPGRADGRLVEISLTPAGQQALAEIVPAAQSVEADLARAVSAEEMATFLHVMEALHGVLDADPEARARAPFDAGQEDAAT